MLQPAPIGPPPTKVLSLMQVVTKEELVNNEGYEDIMEELKIECGKFTFCYKESSAKIQTEAFWRLFISIFITRIYLHRVLINDVIKLFLQATALQTLTGVIRESNAKSVTFITLFIEELLNDIF
nr:splicing factor U2af large subunit B-like isoform X1 [Tanacetum cinerariifolium]